MNANELTFFRTVNAVKDGRMEDTTVTIGGIKFEVKRVVTNRKCYDHTPTYTALVKANGKRVRFEQAMDMLA